MRSRNNVVAANQLKYDRIIRFVYKKTEEMLVRPMTDIWIYTDEPGNWHAVFGAYLNNEPVAYIVWQRFGIVGYEIRPAIRFLPSGALEYDTGYSIE